MKTRDDPSPVDGPAVDDYRIPPDVDRDMLAMAGVLTRVSRLNELFLSSITGKVFGPMKTGYGEPWVLFILTIEGPPYRSSPTALCRRSLLTSGGMTKTLGKLEDAGLVARVYDMSDRRALLVELTPKGREYGLELVRLVAAAYAAIFKNDRAGRYSALRAILTELEQATDQIDTRPTLYLPGDGS